MCTRDEHPLGSACDGCAVTPGDGHDVVAQAFDVAFEGISAACRRRVGGVGDDLAAEAFARAVAHRDDFHGVEHARAWVSRTATNLCIDHARSAGYRRSVAWDESHERVLAAPTDRNPERSFERDQLAEHVTRALSQLRDRDYELLRLRHIEEVSVRDVADATGLHSSSVPVMAARARKRLRALVDRAWLGGLAFVVALRDRWRAAVLPTRAALAIASAAMAPLVATAALQTPTGANHHQSGGVLIESVAARALTVAPVADVQGPSLSRAEGSRETTTEPTPQEATGVEAPALTVPAPTGDITTSSDGPPPDRASAGARLVIEVDEAVSVEAGVDGHDHRAPREPGCHQVTVTAPASSPSIGECTSGSP